MNIDKDITEKKSFIYECDELDLKIKYYKNINKTNFIYYECSKRYVFYKTCKYNKKEKKFYMTQVCDKKIVHDTLNFEDFYKDYKDNKIDKYNMTFRKYQEYYVKANF